MRRPRLTKAVREGWEEIRAQITCILESGQESQFECREANRRIIESGDPDAEPPPLETCPCKGCVATRNALATINWIDSRMAET